MAELRGAGAIRCGCGWEGVSRGLWTLRIQNLEGFEGENRCRFGYVELKICSGKYCGPKESRTRACNEPEKSWKSGLL
jgi:hypothetical protein